MHKIATPNRRNPRRRGRHRRGATVLELSFVLVSLLTVTLGMFDLGVGVFRYHILANAARHAARQAIVHGSMASAGGVWGPTTIDVNANANGIPIIDGTVGGLQIGVQPLLIGCNLPQSRVVASWPQGTNELGDQVTVTVSAPFQPVLTFIFPGTSITLSATSTMQIAH